MMSLTDARSQTELMVGEYIEQGLTRAEAMDMVTLVFAAWVRGTEAQERELRNTPLLLAEPERGWVIIKKVAGNPMYWSHLDGRFHQEEYLATAYDDETQAQKTRAFALFVEDREDSQVFKLASPARKADVEGT